MLERLLRPARIPSRSPDMSLRFYRKPRMVALNPRSPAIEAARALENNNIGAVVVVDNGSVAGIMTDRDLALRVTARGLDPELTLVGDVMSSPVVVLSIEDNQSD